MAGKVACLTTNYGRFGARAAIEHVRDAGVEYIELPLRTAGTASRWGDEPLLTTAAGSAELAEVERLLQDHGVRLASVNALTGNPRDPAVTATICRKIELAADLGVSHVVTDAGAAEDDEDRERLLSNLRTIGDVAGRWGIVVCFETHRGECQNHRKMLDLMRDLDHPQLRLNFDTGNLLYYNETANVEVALAKVCHLVRHVHLKDHTGEYQAFHFPTLGSAGGVDFFRIGQLLRDTGFSGPMSIEIAGVDHEPPLSLEEYHARVCDSAQYLRELGYFAA